MSRFQSPLFFWLAICEVARRTEYRTEYKTLQNYHNKWVDILINRSNQSDFIYSIIIISYGMNVQKKYCSHWSHLKHFWLQFTPFHLSATWCGDLYCSYFWQLCFPCRWLPWPKTNQATVFFMMSVGRTLCLKIPSLILSSLFSTTVLLVFCLESTTENSSRSEALAAHLIKAQIMMEYMLVKYIHLLYLFCGINSALVTRRWSIFECVCF